MRVTDSTEHRSPTAVDGALAPAVDPSLSRDFLTQLLAYANGVLYIKDAAEGRFLLANAALAELVGLPVEQIVGRTTHDILPRETADLHRVNDLEVLGDGLARSSHEFAQHADGTLHEYLSYKFPLFDPSGVPYAIGGISTDVTEMTRANQISLSAQYESEARFRAVFEHAPIGQIFSEIGGVVTQVNAPLATLLGYLPADMQGRPVKEFTDAGEMADIRRTTEQLLSGDSLTVSAIRRFRHRDGHTVPVRVTSALLRDPAGRPRWWVSLVVDISAEERARAELDSAHRATLLAVQRLRLLHSIAAAANESTDIRSAAPDILREAGEHFAWTAGALVRWPDATAASGVPAVEVIACWTDVLHPTTPTDDVAASALARSRSVQLGPDRPDVQIIPPVQGDSSPLAATVCVAIVACGGTELRYGWLFFRDAGSPAGLERDALDVLSIIGLETARVLERQSAQRRLRDSEQRFRSAFADSPLPMALTMDDRGILSEVNDAFCVLVGRTADELVGLAAAALCHHEDRALLPSAARQAHEAVDHRHQFELRLVHASGAIIVTELTITAMTMPDGVRVLLAQVENISARRQAEDSLRRQADEDSLTGLANRSFLNRELRNNAGRNADFAVLFIDLDGFKLINDSRGHEVGDEVLIETARRLELAVRPTDVVARFGGDEFVVLCRGHLDDATALVIARRVEKAMAEPITTGGGVVRVTGSVGVACGRINAARPTELLQRADAAMYHAKRLGKDRSELYDDRLHEHSLAYQRTKAALINALDENRFVLHYQPILDLSTRQITGFEALVRLVDQSGELVAPQQFISVAEETGLIVPMGNWVLHQACAMIARLRRDSGVELTVSVNVAASQASRPDLSDTVSSALAAAELDETALTIELTESALLEADVSTLRQLNELRARGVHIALDDFGTGYSSLTYLRTFPVSFLKVDRSFVAGLGTRKGDLAIVRAVIGLARDLGMGCVAEGIETERQVTEVIALGAQYGQGFLFSRPLPEADLLPLIRAYRSENDV